MSAIRRAFRQLQLHKYLREKNIIRFGYVATAVSIAVFALIPIIVQEQESISAIGDYLSGAGQLIILIWVLVTFWLQREDQVSQRDEQIRLDRSNQQRNIIPIVEIHITHLNLITTNYLNRFVSISNITKSITAISPDNVDATFSIGHLLRSQELQDIIKSQAEKGDYATIMFIDNYKRRFELMRNTIIDVDISNHLHDAFISETEHSDLYFLLRSLDCSMKTDMVASD